MLNRKTINLLFTLAAATLIGLQTFSYYYLSIDSQSHTSPVHKKILFYIFCGSILTFCLLLALIFLINIVLKRKHLEDAIQHDQYELFQSILNCMGDGVVIQEANKEMLLINPAALKICGYNIKDNKIFCVNGNELHNQDINPVEKALAGEPVDNMIYLLKNSLHPDGIYISISMRPLITNTGKLNGSVAVLRDITHIKKTQEELEAFSYSVSHDLRAPLRSIMGFSQILLEEHNAEKLNSESLDALTRIIAATRRMGAVIDGLLVLARLSQQELKKEDIDLSLLVHELASDLQELDHKRKIQFVIQDNIKVNGDHRLLMLIMSNLMNNAYKFSSQKAETRIELGSIILNNKKTFFLRDNGAGFDMRHSDKLFKPFQRLHATRDFPGMGIGLATVQRMIQRHSGKIWAEAEVNKGAIFYFTL
jgi:PAS domain S-box-containing protein